MKLSNFYLVVIVCSLLSLVAGFGIGYHTAVHNEPSYKMGTIGEDSLRYILSSSYGGVILRSLEGTATEASASMNTKISLARKFGWSPVGSQKIKKVDDRFAIQQTVIRFPETE